MMRSKNYFQVRGGRYISTKGYYSRYSGRMVSKENRWAPFSMAFDNYEDAIAYAATRWGSGKRGSIYYKGEHIGGFGIHYGSGWSEVGEDIAQYTNWLYSYLAKLPLQERRKVMQELDPVRREDYPQSLYEATLGEERIEESRVHEPSVTDNLFERMGTEWDHRDYMNEIYGGVIE